MLRPFGDDEFFGDSLFPRRSREGRPRDSMFDDFFGDGFVSMFDEHRRRMDDMMSQVDRNFDDPSAPLPDDGGLHSSTVYSYSSHTGEDGRPVVSKRRIDHRAGPGGVAQTQEMYEDGGSGESRVRVQRRLGDQARTVTKTRDAEGKEHTTDQTYGMNDDERTTFDERWRGAVSQAYSLGDAAREGGALPSGSTRPQLGGSGADAGGQSSERR